MKKFVYFTWNTVTTDHNRELKLARSHWQSIAGSRASKHVQRVPLPRQQNLPPNRFMPSTLSMHKTQKATDSNTIVHPCKSVAMATSSRRYHDNTDLQGETSCYILIINVNIQQLYDCWGQISNSEDLNAMLLWSDQNICTHLG